MHENTKCLEYELNVVDCFDCELRSYMLCIKTGHVLYLETSHSSLDWKTPKKIVPCLLWH